MNGRKRKRTNKNENTPTHQKKVAFCDLFATDSESDENEIAAIVAASNRPRKYKYKNNCWYIKYLTEHSVEDGVTKYNAVLENSETPRSFKEDELMENAFHILNNYRMSRNLPISEALAAKIKKSRVKVDATGYSYPTADNSNKKFGKEKEPSIKREKNLEIHKRFFHFPDASYVTKNRNSMSKQEKIQEKRNREFFFQKNWTQQTANSLVMMTKLQRQVVAKTS